MHKQEERIAQVLAAKKTTAELTLTTGESWLSELSLQEMFDLFSYKA